MYMILVGGGNVGVQLAKRLIASGHEILLMEKEAKQAQRLAAALGDESVLLGDGCEISLQKEAGFSRADVVVAVTGEDEDNLVICQMAKVVWDVDRVVARVNDPTHEEIFKQIGIDDTVSATGIIFSLLEQQITEDGLIAVGAIGCGDIEVVETTLSTRSPFLGRQRAELKMPPETHLIGVLRNGVGHAIDESTRLQEDDTIVLMVPRARVAELQRSLEPIQH